MAKKQEKPSAAAVKPNVKKQKQEPGSSSFLHWILLGAILILTYIIYIPSLDNEFTNWDDDVYVTENSLLVKPDANLIWKTQVGGNHHPLTVYSLAWNYARSGEKPYGYHLTNLMFHLGATVFVFLFVWMLSKKRIWVSIVTTLFFAIHPMHVESVAWVAERKDVLYAFFFFPSLILYLLYLDSDRKNYLWLGLSFVLFILSCLSKPAAVVLPLALFALDYFRERNDWLRILIEKIPFLVISLLIGLWTVQAQKESGAVDDPNRWTIIQKFLFASYGTMMYTVKLFLPFDLSAIYPYPNVEGSDGKIKIDTIFYLAPIIVAVVLGGLIFLFRKSRPVMFGLAFFFINIILVLQFFTVGQAVMADRYTYVPYVGLFFAMAWWLDEHAQGLMSRIPVKPILTALFALLAVISVAQTRARCEVWNNTETLWTDTIRKFPGKIMVAYNNRGHYYRKNKQPDLAMKDYNEAIRLNPKYQLAWSNKGNIFFDKGMMDSALVCYDRALALKDDMYETHGNRGAAKASLGDTLGALEDLNKAVQLRPDYRMGYSNRALVLEMMNRYDEAFKDYQKVLDLDPRNPENHRYWNALGVICLRTGRFQESIGYFDKTLTYSLDRNFTGIYYMNRAYGYNGVGDKAKALDDLKLAQSLGANVDPAFLASLGGK